MQLRLAKILQNKHPNLSIQSKLLQEFFYLAMSILISSPFLERCELTGERLFFSGQTAIMVTFPWHSWIPLTPSPSISERLSKVSLNLPWTYSRDFAPLVETWTATD